MLRLVIIGIFILLSAVGGYYIPRLYNSQVALKLNFPDPNTKIFGKVTPGESYGCKAMIEARAYEDRFDKTANAQSSIGTDKFALKIAEDGKGIFLLSAVDVQYGATDAGNPIPITLKTDDYIVANRAVGLDVNALILNLKTFKGVFSYTGQGMLGIKGHSFLLDCH